MCLPPTRPLCHLNICVLKFTRQKVELLARLTQSDLFTSSRIRERCIGSKVVISHTEMTANLRPEF